MHTTMAEHNKLILVSKLSCGISSVVSVIYIVLSILGIVLYFQCSYGNAATQSQVFWSKVYTTYLQESDCNNTSQPISGVTQPFTVFVFMTVILSFATVHLITATALFIQISNKEHAKYFNVYVYTYIGAWTATLVIDLTLGTFLGMDIALLADKLDNSLDPDSELHMVRQGAFQLMAIVLKGFVIYAINFVLIILIIVYNRDYHETAKDEQSLYLSRPINAYDTQLTVDTHYYTLPKLLQALRASKPAWLGASNTWNENYGYIESPSRSDNLYSSNTHTDHDNLRNPYREMNYQHQWFRNAQLLQVPTQAPRPFSYEAPMKSQPKRMNAWPAPRVPAPDYSPESPRRLKSALKP